MALRFLLASCAGLSLASAPVTLAAQDAEAPAGEVMVDDPAAGDEPDTMEQAMAMLGAMFPAEPLTAEQQARLPAAQGLIAKIIPEGTMGEMIDKMMGGVLGPIMAAAPDGATTTLAKQIGTEPYALDLTEEQAGELASLFDPAWAERQKRELAAFPIIMKEMVTLMEPGMRKAMSELYAIRFSATELAEIDAFFSTGTGGRYARESFLMASDPRIMASTMEALPALMGSIGDIEKRMAESTADLPAKRAFAELTAAEKAKVAEMTGITVEEIESNLEMLNFGVEEAFTSVKDITAEVEADAAADADDASEAAESE